VAFVPLCDSFSTAARKLIIGFKPFPVTQKIKRNQKLIFTGFRGIELLIKQIKA